MLKNIISMNGYGIYVWPAYLFMMLIFAINLFTTVKEKKYIHKMIRLFLKQNNHSS